MNAPAPQQTFDQALALFNGQVSRVAQQIAMVLPSHITIEFFQRVLMAAVKADPDLLRADRRSLLNACEKCAIDGLIPDKREAALVVFKRNYKDAQGAWQQALEVQYMPMAYGLRKKILQSGEITDITAKVVYRCEVESGAFIYEEGTEAMLRHRPMLEMTEEQAKDENIVAAYSMATYKDGSKSYEVMRRFEIDKVRECSQTGATKDKRGQARKPSGPWVDWYPEQCKKTAMRRHSKTLPMSSDLVDVEGADLDAVARSTQAMLSVEADAPTTIAQGPKTVSLSDQSSEGNGTPIDLSTGEVLQMDPVTTMTVVDEDTARQLDVQTLEGGRADHEHGDQHDGSDDGAAADDTPAYAAWVKGVHERIAAATTPAFLRGIEDEMKVARESLPDDVVKVIDDAVAKRRAAILKKA